MLLRIDCDWGIAHRWCPTIITFISVCLMMSTSWTPSVAFNLENRLPIVKRGVDGTYFGYSVASHVVTMDHSNQSW